MYQFSGS